MRHNTPSNSLQLPAKALLFGEYGLLKGLPGVVVTLPEHSCVFEWEWTPRQDVPLVVESEFFKSGKIQLASSLEAQNAESRFFAAIVAPYRDIFSSASLRFKVTQAFSPSLGFGSSSAILAALHCILFEKTFSKPISTALTDVCFWERVRTALDLAQNGGSGYDVAVQLAAAEKKQVAVWKYQWNPSRSVVPEIEEIEFVPRGIIVSSGVYSDTKRAICAFAKDERKDFFAARHGQVAAQFLASLSRSDLVPLVNKSADIAFEQGLFAEENVSKLTQLLRSHGIPHKSLGAGCGDTFWLLCNHEGVARFSHPVTGKPLTESIVYEFEKQV